MIGYETLKNWAIRLNDRQNDTTDSTIYDQRMCMGWGQINGDGVSRGQLETVTFPITFDNNPVVIVSFIGAIVGSAANSIDDFVTGSYTVNAVCDSITTTNFVARIARNSTDGGDPGVLTSGTRYGYSWIAIGTSAI